MGDEYRAAEPAEALERLRRRYRVLLRKEIGRTLIDSGEVDEEKRALFAVVSGSDSV